MPFSAIDERNNKINIVDRKKPELHAMAADLFRCIDPLCNGIVKIKAINSEYKDPHFAHKPGQLVQTCRAYKAGAKEKPEHVAAKWAVMAYYNSLPGYTVSELEFIDADIIADVATYTSDGRKICNEIELSRPEPESIEGRTLQRSNLGWETVWFFDVDSQKAQTGIGWARETLDNYGTLKFTKDGGKISVDCSIIDARKWRAKRDADRIVEDAKHAAKSIKLTAEQEKRRDWAIKTEAQIKADYSKIRLDIIEHFGFPNPIETIRGMYNQRIDFNNAREFIKRCYDDKVVELVNKNQEAHADKLSNLMVEVERLRNELSKKTYDRNNYHIGKEFKTSLGGVMTVEKYDAAHDAYKGESRCWWKLEDGIMCSYYEKGNVSD